MIKHSLDISFPIEKYQKWPLLLWELTSLVFVNPLEMWNKLLSHFLVNGVICFFNPDHWCNSKSTKHLKKSTWYLVHDIFYVFVLVNACKVFSLPWKMEKVVIYDLVGTQMLISNSAYSIGTSTPCYFNSQFVQNTFIDFSWKINENKVIKSFLTVLCDEFAVFFSWLNKVYSW